MQLGYFQVMAEPVSTWVQEILALRPRQSPRLVTKLKTPPLPSLSPGGTTEPRYFFTSSGCSRIASEIEQKMTPALASSSLKVVTTEIESNTASTATLVRSTPASTSRSRNGMPSFS